MKKYEIVLSPQADADLSNLFYFITIECSSISTAIKYSEGLQKNDK